MERTDGWDRFAGGVWEALGAAPEVRWGRVLELRRQVEEGSYLIPIEEVARRLLEMGLLHLLDGVDD